MKLTERGRSFIIHCMGLPIIENRSTLNTFLIPQNQCVESRVSAAIRASIAWLKIIFTFPFRYLGSKTWSIPGVILRAPWLVFKRIFTKVDLSLKEELFGNGQYHYFFEKTIKSDELKPYLPYAAATNFVYHENPKYLLPGWAPIRSEILNIRDEDPLFKQEAYPNPISGFKASLLGKGDELVICFAPLEKRPRDDRSRWQRISAFVRGFFGGNKPIKNIVGLMSGFKPAAFEQADTFVGRIQNLPEFKDKKITLAGLCYGGIFASYVGIKRGIRTVCLNSLPLGVGLQHQISSDRLSRAGEYVTHICAKGDWVSDSPGQAILDLIINRLGFRTPGLFGRKFLVPTAYPKSRSATHGNPVGSILKHLGYNEEIELKDISLESN